jgi:hypothetical protein
MSTLASTRVPHASAGDMTQCSPSGLLRSMPAPGGRDDPTAASGDRDGRPRPHVRPPTVAP